MTEVHVEHPFLHHYTSRGGLEGILSSKSLWGTHYKALNDYSEIEHMRNRMEDMTFRIINAIMRRTARASLKYKLFLEKNGGIYACSKKEARTVTDVFYQITFDGRNDGEVGSYAEPYITSFCSHAKDDEYTRKHGLLSMWRAYGNEGGFALVFDTKALSVNLRKDPETYFYTAFHLVDAIYDSDDIDTVSDFGDLTAALETFLEQLAAGESNPRMGDAFQPFITAVSRFKHRGFREESEVRLVAAPASERLVSKMRETQGDENKTGQADKKVKPVLTRDKFGNKVQYIELNAADEKGNLPLQRIIVGPQREQEKNLAYVNALIGNEIEVVRSETPFIPF